MTENEKPLDGTPAPGEGEQPETTEAFAAANDDPAEEAAAVVDEMAETVEAASAAAAQAVDEVAEALDADPPAAQSSTEEPPPVEPAPTEPTRQPIMNRLVDESAHDVDASDDDRLMAALAYISQMFFPLILPIIILISETSKKRPFQRYHAVQSLALGLVIWTLELVLLVLLGTIGLLFCCILLPAMTVLWLLPLYYGILANQGKRFSIPGLTQFLADQGWL